MTKCTTTTICLPLAKRLEGGPCKGFRAHYTVKADEEDVQLLGVAYHRTPSDKGTMLNCCPFCYGRPGYFERKATP